MNASLLKILICPRCKSSLRIKGAGEEDVGPEEEIVSGKLNCPECGLEYPIEEGMPRFVRLNKAGNIFDNSKDAQTAYRFNYAWRKFASQEVSLKWHKDSFSYIELLPKSIFEGSDMLGLDVGCGSGADLIYMSQKGLKMVGIDVTDSVTVAFNNTKGVKNIEVIQANIYNMPFKEGAFDLVYSFGVLHHLSDPEKVFREIVKLLKNNGTVIICVYEKFTHRSMVERGVLRLVGLFRRVTSRLPPKALHIICIILSPFIVVLFSLPARLLEKFKFTKRIAQRMPFRHTARIDCIIADLYDRFSPPIENRYTSDEIKGWFKKANLCDINIINYRGWVAWGKKKA
ncbi:MAG: methyltransferase domain-containing protein [Candidatus Omnitrophica bacterium]|nr:methyltransferase domain-containing protein [Candidatus Omnitrophota bacterium]